MATRMRFWNVVLVLLSAANVVSVWFAALPGEAAHATLHAGLAVAFGLWAQRRMQVDLARRHPGELDEGNDVEIAALGDEVGEVRRELDAMQERLDFAERLLSQSRDLERRSDRGEVEH